MKSLKNASILIAAASLSLASCKDKCTTMYTYEADIPVYLSYEELRSGVEVGTPQSLKQPGKIFHIGNWIFVNEHMKGVHIIDNANPAAPVPISFITIPGNMDISVQGSVMYADSYVDLLTFDVSNPSSARLLNRLENALPYNPNGADEYDPALGVVAETRKSIVTREKQCNEPMPNVSGTEDNGGWGSPETFGRSGGNEWPTGRAGSMARFAASDNILYVAGENDLRLFNISNATNPSAGQTMLVGPRIETIFPHENMLFLGSQNGMYIYDISNESNPELLSVYEHVESCDPVVVQGDLAYVAMRSGTTCNRGQNLLDVVDISNPSNPEMIASHAMTNPHGIGINGKVLFVCEGTDGLKLFDASDAMNIGDRMMKHLPASQSFDVIPHASLAIVSGAGGLYQYAYTQDFNVELLSIIPVEP